MFLNDLLEQPKMKMVEGGYMVAEPRVARSGIQLYAPHEVGLADSGRMIRVYRSPDEVFSPESMRSFVHKPICVDHPPIMLDATSWRRFARGQTGDEVTRDGDTIRVPMMLLDADAIKSLQNGRRQLSVGYTCDVLFEPGTTPDGEPFDAVQKNIRANHIAVVNAARGGERLRIGDAGDESIDCPACGHAVPDDVEKCPNCGHDFTAPSPEAVREAAYQDYRRSIDHSTSDANGSTECQKCRHAIPFGKKRCPNCGALASITSNAPPHLPPSGVWPAYWGETSGAAEVREAAYQDYKRSIDHSSKLADFNPHHDPHTGQFTSGAGGPGEFAYAGGPESDFGGRNPSHGVLPKPHPGALPESLRALSGGGGGSGTTTSASTASPEHPPRSPFPASGRPATGSFAHPAEQIKAMVRATKSEVESITFPSVGAAHAYATQKAAQWKQAVAAAEKEVARWRKAKTLTTRQSGVFGAFKTPHHYSVAVDQAARELAYQQHRHSLDWSTVANGGVPVHDYEPAHEYADTPAPTDVEPVAMTASDAAYDEYRRSLDWRTQSPPAPTGDTAPAGDATTRQATRDAAYADMCAELSNAWRKS